MRYLDIENWNRKAHFSFFKEFDYPHFNICGNMDITEFIGFIKDKGDSFFLALLYASVKTANSIEEFRYRIRQDKVVVHDIVSPSFTIMTSNEVFSFCTADYADDYSDFYRHASHEMEKSKNNVNMRAESERDDLLYITSIPWVSFTGIIHPINMKPVDSIPRISWGKYFEESGRVKLPLSVQAHHALVDGAHIGQYFIKLQELLDNPKVNF
jgi:chloramphenicol O-acetyltransferase type A